MNLLRSIRQKQPYRRLIGFGNIGGPAQMPLSLGALAAQEMAPPCLEMLYLAAFAYTYPFFDALARLEFRHIFSSLYLR